jgi:hypothetical protein
MHPLLCHNLDLFQLCLSRAIPAPLSINIDHSAWTAELLELLAPFSCYIRELDFSSFDGHKRRNQGLPQLDLITLEKLTFYDPLEGFEEFLAQILDSIHSSVKGSLSFDFYLGPEGIFSALCHPALLKSNQISVASGIISLWRA